MAFALITALAIGHAQQIDTTAAVEHVMAASRLTLVGSDSPALIFVRERFRSATQGVSELQWKEFEANVLPILQETYLQEGSPAYKKIQVRLRVLTLDELNAIDTMLRSPAYKSYQTALAGPKINEDLISSLAAMFDSPAFRSYATVFGDPEIVDSIMDSLMVGWPRILELAKQAGIKIQ